MFIPISSELRREGVPYVSLSIVLLCTVIFVFEWISAALHSRDALRNIGVYHALFYDYALDSKRFFQSSPFSLSGLRNYFTLISHGFLHGGWFHLFFNMLFFFGFAGRIEKRLGHLRFIFFYLGSLATCGLLVAFYNEYITHHRTVLIGASGAVSAVMGAFLVKFPHERIHTIVWVIVRIWVMRLSAWFLVGFSILSNLYSFLRDPSNQGSRVSFIAHLFGFASGIALIWAFTGFRVESQASQRKGQWKDGLRSFRSVLSTEARALLLLFVAAPLLAFSFVFALTYMIQTRYHWILWRQGDTFQTRMRLTYVLVFDYLPLVLLGLALVGGGLFWWWRQRKLRQAFDEQQRCIWCQSEDLQMKEDDIGYTCRKCGFDSDIEQDPLHAANFNMLREAQITLHFLREAQLRVTSDETQSSMFALDDDRLKDTFGSFGEAYEVFRDYLQRHESQLQTRLSLPQEENDEGDNEASRNPQDLFSKMMRKGLQIDLATSDGAGGYLREQKKLLADAIVLMEHVTQSLRSELKPLIVSPPPTAAAPL